MVGTKVSGSDAQEPILQENPDRFCMFPIKYTAVWEMYKKAEASFWTGMLQYDDVTQHLSVRTRVVLPLSRQIWHPWDSLT